MFHIHDLPDDLPPGDYNMRLRTIRPVRCRDGSVDYLFEGEYAGPKDPHGDLETLLSFTKYPEGTI